MPSYSYVKESRVQMNKSNQSLDNSLVQDIIDCLFLVEFDDNDKCKLFCEWWHLREVVVN
jgi:hypothetical protein